MARLADMLAMRIRQQTLAGLRLGARRQIVMEADGRHATLLLGWDYLDSRAGWRDLAPEGEPCGDYHVTIDTRNMPEGIDIGCWSAPSDTRDLIDRPARAEIVAAARAMSCRYIDHQTGRDHDVYILW